MTGSTQQISKMRTSSILLSAAISSFSVGVIASLPPIIDTAPPLSFVFLLSESLDGRLFREGSAAKIPNIRALLSSGSVTFDSAYSNDPVCAPSRSSLFSGRAPHKIPHQHNGMLVGGVWNNYEGLDANYSTRMDQLLGNAGYHVQLTGKMDVTVGSHTESCRLESLTFNVAWPYNITENGGWNQETDMCSTQGTISPGGTAGSTGSAFPDDWKSITETAAFAATAPQPFFAYAGTSILHPPYQTTQYWYDVAAEQVLPEWPSLSDVHPCDLQSIMKRGCSPSEANTSAFNDPVRVARVRRIYLSELEEWDAMVGTVVAAVTKAGRLNTTVFVLAADHGDMQLDHQLFYKMVPYDASSRIPLAFAWTGISGARSITQPAQLLDIFPTLLSLAQQPVPSYADGFDLTPYLKGASNDPSRPLFVAIQNHDEDISSSWFAVCNGTHKYVVYGDGQQVPPQLFNLIDDGVEMVNLAPSSPADVALLDTALLSLINYPAVAMEVATYQKAQLRYWQANSADWKKEAASLRWSPGWSAYPQLSLDALESYLKNDTIAILPCNGALAANT